ncbi:MAG: hypothetical protein NTV43_18175 [Methylococcales bacterium]|nr:hypothetical protein [Methylococcales bacterium]
MNEFLLNLAPFLLLLGVLLAGIILIVLFFACWIFFGSMRYSPEANIALQRLMSELRSQASYQNQGVLKIESIWTFGYPKVAVLFESSHALEQATMAGLLEQLAIRVTHFVKSEPAFGRNRGSFDPKQAIWAIADRQFWDSHIKSINKPVSQ